MKDLFKIIRQYRYWIIAGLLMLAILTSIWNRLTRPAPSISPSPTPIEEQVTPNSTDQPLFSPGLQSPEISPTPIAVLSPTPTPTVSPSPIEIITEERMQFAELDDRTKELYYLAFDTAILKKMSLITKEVAELGELSAYVNYITWSPNRTKVLVKMENREGNRVPNPLYQDDLEFGAPVVGLYDIGTKTFTRLNSSISSFAFLTDETIIYQYKDDRYNNLSISEPTGANWKNIERLATDLQIKRFGNSVLIQSTKENKVRRFNKEGKVTETHTVPPDFALNKSSWTELGKSAVYWTGDNPVSIKKLNLSTTTPLAQLAERPQDFTILWDNRNNVIYSASFDGLAKFLIKP